MLLKKQSSSGSLKKSMKEVLKKKKLRDKWKNDNPKPMGWEMGWTGRLGLTYILKYV